MNFEYFTINKESEIKYVEKRSVFIGNSKSISTQEEANRFIQSIKQKYNDARHNCYAYKIGSYEKYSDDGEPQGTAGIPLLSVINKKQLNNCIVIVTRYFGGILLGAPGLVRAYSTTASQVIDASEIRKVKLYVRYNIECSYQKYDKISILLNSYDLIPFSINYNENISFRVDVPKEIETIFIENFINSYNLCLKSNKIDEIYK